jgi:peptidoglycan-associated lipoprotein
MRRSHYTLVVLMLVLVSLFVSGTGCKKKVAPPPPPVKEEPPPPPPPPPAPAPTVNLKISPAAIEKGSSATLSWSSSNATGVVIDQGIGTVEPSGSRSLKPTASTTYKAKATGPGGEAVAEARITVTEPPPPPKPIVITDAEFFKTNIKDAFFDYDKYDIREDARAALSADARALKERTSIQITIEGHCDERGSTKYNLALGDRRANAAKDFLVSQGIDGSRIDTVSYGEERPFCMDKNEACWQQNRRAHVIMR